MTTSADTGGTVPTPPHRGFRWQRALGIALALVLLLVAGGALYLYLSFGCASEASCWEGEITAFERRDREAKPAPGAVLFVGSSSIRLWRTLEADLAPVRVLNRGFGGAHMDHVVAFAPRIVTPYAPAVIAVYAGDNDIGFGKTPARVVADFERFVALVRDSGSRAPIFFLAIKPSRLRWDRWPDMAEANRRIAALASADASLHYVDVATPMLDARAPDDDTGPPPSDLFLFDGLHLSSQGYALWTRVVRARLAEVLGDALPR